MIGQTNRQTEIYMLSIAGQTTGPIGLTFFVGTPFFKMFFFKFVFLPWATPGPLASIYIIKHFSVTYYPERVNPDIDCQTKL